MIVGDSTRYGEILGGIIATAAVAEGIDVLTALPEGGLMGPPAPKGTAGPRVIEPSTLPLPGGKNNATFGELLNWPRGTGDSAAKMAMAKEALNGANPEFLGNLRNQGVTPDMLQKWAEFYRGEAIRVPQNPTATARAVYLEELIKRMER